MKDYLLEISYDATRADLGELLEARLFLSASTGNTTREADGLTTVSAYFDTPEERDAARELFVDVAGIELQSADRERLDWLALYQQSLEPLFIGRSFVVVPDVALIPDDTTRHRLVVPQEQAFGTGSHETTSLCIELLEDAEVSGRRGLDVGSGSGILALAMLRLGASRAIAFDNDPDAYGALRDNRMRNGIDDAQMPLFIGSVEALGGGRFDIVTMNIIPEVIIPLLPEVTMHLHASSLLILSGILVIKRDDVVAAATNHSLRLARERTRGEWWAGEFEHL